MKRKMELIESLLNARDSRNEKWELHVCLPVWMITVGKETWSCELEIVIMRDTRNLERLILDSMHKKDEYLILK